MIYGLSDDDLSRLDLTDGTTTDWQEVVGDPSYWADAFDDLKYTYDPTDLDFRIWLAWHPASGRLYGAYESSDDQYVDRFVHVDERGTLELPGDSFSFMVDGDHSGGKYGDVSFEEEIKCAAQLYTFTASRFEGRYINSDSYLATWYLAPPYADAHGSVTGEDPVVSVIEFYLTPFDDRIWQSPDRSVPSQLWAGKIIGVNIAVADPDTPGIEPWNDPSLTEFNMSGKGGSFEDARQFVDAVLLASGASSSAVEDLSWARIKAGFRQRR